MKFYLLEKGSNNEVKFTYSLNTLPATSVVLKTLSNEDFAEKENEVLELPDRFLELIETFSQMVDNSTVYWHDV